MATRLLQHPIWTDTSLFDKRYQRLEALLLAISRVVKKHNLLPVPHPFQGWTEWLFNLHPEYRMKILRDPGFCYWARLAYELVRLVLHGGPPPPLASAFLQFKKSLGHERVLEHHFNQFCLFITGASVLSGENVDWLLDVDVPLPVSVPGTKMAITAAGHATLHGRNKGGIDLSYQGCRTVLSLEERENRESRSSAQNTDTRPFLLRATEVQTNGVSIALNPAVFNHPELDFSQLVVDSGWDYQHQHAGALEESISALSRYAPGVFHQFRDLINVVALKPSVAGTFRDNLSHSDLPGAIVLKPVYQPHYLAHVLVHEFHHNRLFFLEDGNPILAPPSTDHRSNPSCYSPWRTGPRPHHGILHGVYVTLPVIEFWIAVFDDTGLDNEVNMLARDQAARGLAQASVGLHQLNRFASYTPAGEDLISQMGQDLIRLGGELSNRDIHPGAPSVSGKIDSVYDYSELEEFAGANTVIDEIEGHLRRYATAAEEKSVRSEVLRALN